ncbi:hypothetical protein J3B02_001739 [Coemansia erecta]|uniref:Uncharacterized protein n=1 Tax=Coemansia asiatica TaxID=1052880 RepID=A0A9W8CIC3_9FUNG|nr:hypothetical protein LPJ64_005139 [Coemansia asiatica]KAJ2856202.1 hypothetical protein J3B02_001739 [Coemansia erecta]KAJ2887517.1 hypothetical protein FB639_001258 [Coemansia asiatica]
MKPQLCLTTLVALLGSRLCSADIVLSVASAENMDEYLAVLSNAWPSLYPKLDGQLQVARKQVPAEYNYLMQLLSVTGVPTEYDEGWARAFIGNAQNIGPTTIFAESIPEAENDPVAQPTQLVSTEDGIVATVEATVARPTIVVAINGNAVRNAHHAEDSESATQSSSDDSEFGIMKPGNGSSEDSSTTSGAVSSWSMAQVANSVAIASIASLAVAAFF